MERAVLRASFILTINPPSIPHGSGRLQAAFFQDGFFLAAPFAFTASRRIEHGILAYGASEEELVLYFI